MRSSALPLGLLSTMTNLNLPMTGSTDVAGRRVEFVLLYAAVFTAPYVSLHHSALFFTVSDFFFLAALAARALSGLPLLPLGAGTQLWFTGVIMLQYGLLVSSLFYGDVARGFIVFSQYLFTYVGLPLALTSRPFGEATSLAKASVLAMVAMCVFGIGAYAWGYNGGTNRHFMIVSGAGRLAGFVDNPNGLGVLIAFTLPLLWTLTSMGSFRLITSVLLSVPLFVALILTSSNTGLMTVAMAILVFLIGRRQVKTLAIAAAVAGAVAVAINFGADHYLPATFQKRVWGAVENGDISEAGTFASRYELMQEAWRLADRHFLAGMGADQYRVISEYGMGVHNTYLLLWNEGGLISLCGFLLILASAVIAAIAGRRGQYGHMALLCVVAIVAITAVKCMTTTHAYARFMTVPLMLSIGLVVSAPARRPAVPMVRHGAARAEAPSG
jgi:O-antigen ligase